MKINEKGQVVIPKEIRARHGFVPGQEVEFWEREEELVLVKKESRRRIEQALEEFSFELPEDIEDTDELVERLRGRW